MMFSLTPEQHRIREEILSMRWDDLNVATKERYLNQTFDRDLWLELGKHKIQGLCIPQEYGGLGYDPLTTVIALETFGEACNDGGLCFAVSAHLLASCVPLWLYGSESQKRKYLPKLCDGTSIGANAMTEASSGSDAFSMLTSARQVGDSYILNGSKTFVTNAPESDVLITYASTDKEKGFLGGITAFLLDRNDCRFQVSKITGTAGLKTCTIGEVQFDDLSLDQSEVLGKVGRGASVFNTSMDWERICLGAIHLGTMSRLLKNAVKYAKKNNASQAVTHQLANLKVDLETVRLLTYRSAVKLGERKNVALDASMTKLRTSETFQNFALIIFEVYKDLGLTDDHDIRRTLTDAMASTIYSGTSEIQRDIIAKQMGI